MPTRLDTPSWAKASAVLAVLAAALGTWIALVTYWVFCANYEGTEPCLGRRTEFEWHLVLAAAGLLVAIAMLVCALTRRRRAAAWLLALGLALYTASFMLSDAGVHGWGHLKVFPNLS